MQAHKYAKSQRACGWGAASALGPVQREKEMQALGLVILRSITPGSAGGHRIAEPTRGTDVACSLVRLVQTQSCCGRRLPRWQLAWGAGVPVAKLVFAGGLCRGTVPYSSRFLAAPCSRITPSPQPRACCGTLSPFRIVHSSLPA